MFEDNDDGAFRGNRDYTQELPIYKKAQELYQLVDHITKAVENTDITFKNRAQESWLHSSIDYMRENALIIPAKIAGAEGADIYDLRMENATLIRKAARELITDARGLQMNGYKDEEYLDLLRIAVDEFRVLFAEWVQGFDDTNYIIDRWGLFNPIGVHYDDHDPDDDLPFNDMDYMDEFDDDEDEDDWDDDDEDEADDQAL